MNTKLVRGIIAVFKLIKRFRAKRAVLVIVVGLALFWAWQYLRPMVIGDASISGKQQIVRSRVIEKELTYSAEIQSNREKAYRQSVGGTLAKTGAKLGDYVKTGGFLAQIDSNSIQEEQEQNRKNLLKLEQEIAIKRKNLESAKLLYTRDLGSQQAVIDAKNMYAAAIEEQDALKRKLAESTGAVKSLTITAQFSGYITDQMVFAGNTISADQVIFVQSDLTDLYARFFVSNKYKELLRVGLAVQYYDPYSKAKICDGQISYIGKFAAQKGILVEASFKPSTAEQALNYYKQPIEIRIKVGQSSDSVPSVPLSAIYFDSHGPYLFQIHSGITKQTRVRLGYVGSQYVEIKSADPPIQDPVLIESEDIPRAGMSFKRSDGPNAH